MSRGERESDESLSDTGDVALQDEKPVQVKEEEAEEQPAAKRKREQTDEVETVNKAPVDAECKKKLGKAHVYSEGNDVYDVMLNQTNIQLNKNKNKNKNKNNDQNNNNKYYLIQLLEDDDSESYSVWMRWGRVGKVGESRLTACDRDLLKAKKVFKDMFWDKTKNKWDDRKNFNKVEGQYEMVLIDHNTNEKLDVKIQSLLKLICDLKAMEEMNIAPLGKLSPKQIDAGKEALKSIEECLKKGTDEELLEACSRFYTRIPHDFGMKHPPKICTKDELKKKFALLEKLRAIDEHPLDKLYHSLQCDLQLLDSSSNEYQVIENYLKTTRNSTDMTVLNIFSVNKKGESDKFLSQSDNRTLLWYGSRLSNWVSILRKGLKVAPTAGFMVGEGTYFADMSSEAAKSCCADKNNPEGLLLLCEVALGNCHEIADANYEASNLPDGKHSTKILGRTGPDPKNSETLDDGVIVPMGPGATREGHTLPYNRFIVYNPAQVRMRYLLRIRFK